MSARVSKQAILFAIVGVLTTLLHVAVAVSVIRTFTAPAWLANGVAFVVATSFSYVVNASVTFGSRPAGRSLLRYFVVAIVGLLLAMAISALADRAGLSYLAGIACVVVAVSGGTFIAHRNWTYAK
jgi:putative flippase GtrA